jgi:hypothetical protein
MSAQVQGYQYLSLATVRVGSAVVASKIIASEMSPSFLALMRLNGIAWPSLERRDGVLLLLQAGGGAAAPRRCTTPPRD